MKKFLLMWKINAVIIFIQISIIRNLLRVFYFAIKYKYIKKFFIQRVNLIYFYEKIRLLFLFKIVL